MVYCSFIGVTVWFRLLYLYLLFTVTMCQVRIYVDFFSVCLVVQ